MDGATVKISGKNAVVTGGASGIGKGIVEALASAGAAGIVIADVDEAGAQEVVDSLTAAGVRAFSKATDVSDEKAVEDLADFAWANLGGVDIVCNNAGVTAAGDPLAASEDDTRWEVDVNLFGVIHGTRVFSRRFLAEGVQGWICNTSSHNGFGAPFPNVAGYVATKHGSFGYTDALRSQYGDRIGFSVLCPGPVNTNVWDAGRSRPERFGGPTSGDPANADFLAQVGVDPRVVGQYVVDGIEADAFVILTDPADVELARRRFEEVAKAGERQFPDYEHDPSAPQGDVYVPQG